MDIKKQDSTEPNREIIAGVLEGQGSRWGDLKSGGFDPDALWRRVDENDELLLDLINVFETEFPEMMRQLEATIRRGDAVGVERSSHKIKGSLLQFSAHAAAAAALRLEQLGRSGAVAGAEVFFQGLTQETDLLLKSLHTMARRVRGDQR
ncbi:MAG TPA: Hpt domain-containing protein [Candidatus Sulfotelmatobacter sp.]|nr:Hpt domain-containing protein [Candidatus Sulfotelmatobacter sp.]